jgi:molybdopterin-synthase adenylyltransferase
MALSDIEIERFSRQIVLPQVGGRGQERLRSARVALAGRGTLAETAALYIAGAGVGRMLLHGDDRERLCGALCDLGPTTDVASAEGCLGSATVDLLVGGDAAPQDLDHAAASRLPLLAAGSEGAGGWLLDSAAGACAGCASRAAHLGAPATPLDAPAAGVLGSLLALAVLQRLLDLSPATSVGWLRFDARRSTLDAEPLPPAADCPACGAAR